MHAQTGVCHAYVDTFIRLSNYIDVDGQRHRLAAKLQRVAHQIQKEAQDQFFVDAQDGQGTKMNGRLSVRYLISVTPAITVWSAVG